MGVSWEAIRNYKKLLDQSTDGRRMGVSWEDIRNYNKLLDQATDWMRMGVSWEGSEIIISSKTRVQMG
jgi:hypothetical protein